MPYSDPDEARRHAAMRQRNYRARRAAADPDYYKEKNKKQYGKNPERFITAARNRQKKLSNRTPAWADMEAINNVYLEAKNTGATVDHIIPLCGAEVSGLHVHNNLRVISGKENDRKGNKFYADQIREHGGTL